MSCRSFTFSLFIFVKYRHSLIIIINYHRKRLTIYSAYVTFAIGSIIIYESLIALRPSGTTKSCQVTRRNDHAYVEANHQKLIAVVLRCRYVRKRESSNNRIFKPLFTKIDTSHDMYRKINDVWIIWNDMYEFFKLSTTFDIKIIDSN